MPQEAKTRVRPLTEIEFADVIARLERLRPDEMVHISVYEVQRLLVSIENVKPEVRDHIRRILRKLYFCSPITHPTASYIRKNLQSFVFTQRELALLQQENLRLKESKNVIESEIKSGRSPWAAHVSQNKRNIFNPLLVGFYQESTGTIRPIYGTRIFSSLRQIENTFFVGRTPEKEVNLLEATFLQVDEVEILKGAFWTQLPSDLRQNFENGKILVTTSTDIYAMTNSEVEQIVNSDEPSTILELIDIKMHQASSGEKKYFFLYYSDYRSNENGRTGVILVGENGKMQPLKIQIEDRQFVVEVKACGTKNGGFGQNQTRTDGEFIKGGAERSQAITEFSRLHDDSRIDAPKAAGSILFQRNGSSQGYIIRLTPSTIRASFTNSEVYPQIDSPEIVRRVISMYAQLLVENIFCATPKIVDRSAHTENILVWGENQFAFTDYSDHAAFSDTNYPHEENNGGYLTPKTMLQHSIMMVREIPGYLADRDRGLFLADIQHFFGKKGVNLQLSNFLTDEQVVQLIWEKEMAYQVFKARSSQGYVAEGVLADYRKITTGNFATNNVAIHSTNEFNNRLAAALSQMSEAINILLGQKLDHQDVLLLTNWRQQLNHGDLYEAILLLNSIFSIYRSAEKMPEHQRKYVYKAYSYFEFFAYVLVTPIQKYFEHELDVIRTAKLSAPLSQLHLLNLAEIEVLNKMQLFKQLINGDTSKLLETYRSSDEIRKFITFDFYKSKLN